MIRKTISFFSFCIIELVILLTVSSCVDKGDLNDAITSGYTKAFNAVAGNQLSEDKIRLSDEDYDDICWYFKDFDDFCDDDSLEVRWEYIHELITEKTSLDVERIDKDQWLFPNVMPKDVKVKVFLDNTESMMGYMGTDDQSFAHAVSFVENFCKNKNYSNICGYYLDNKGIKQVEWRQFRDDITNNHVRKPSDSYSLHEFLSTISVEIAQDEKYSTLAIFVTDGIPSGTNEQIRNSPNRRYNIENDVNLINDISNAVKSLKIDNAVSIYQCNGKFKGLYRFYNNDSETFNEVRPFYIIVIGHKKLVEQYSKYVNNEVEAGHDVFRPKNQVHFINKTDSKALTLISDDITSISGNNNEYYVNETKVNDGEAKNLKINIPLNGLADYIKQDTATVRKSVNVFVAQKLQEYKFTKLNDKWAIELVIPKMDYSELSVVIQVTDVLPNWVEHFNEPNDKMKHQGTFGLRLLVQGLREGFFGNDSYQVKQEFILKIKE